VDEIDKIVYVIVAGIVCQQVDVASVSSRIWCLRFTSSVFHWLSSYLYWQSSALLCYLSVSDGASGFLAS